MSILTQKEIIMRGREVHGDLYDYSLVEYITYHTKIKIKCQGHGIFEQTPANHIHRKSGCPKCAITHKPQHMPHPTKKFIEKANKVHDNLYDYSNIDYKNTHTPIEIICQEHGPFMQRPVKHLQGCNCPKCSFS